jgi:hypothetical protein
MRLGDYAVVAAAFVAFVTSVYLWFNGQRDEGLFVGLWVPSILAFAGYLRVCAGRRP